MFLVGTRYDVIRVYPLFWRTKSKTIKIFGLRIFRPRNAYRADPESERL